MKESKIFGEKMTDFEKNLFLKREVKELKEAIKKLLNEDGIKKRDFKIGELTSEVDELKYKLSYKLQPTYESMTKAQKKNFKYKMRDEVSENHKKQIQILEEVIIKRNKRIEELENELNTLNHNL